MVESARLFIKALWRYAWLFAISASANAAWIYQIKTGHTVTQVPSWILGLLAIGTLLVAAFLAFHYQRAESERHAAHQSAPYFAGPVTFNITGAQFHFGNVRPARPSSGDRLPERTIEGVPSDYRVVNVWELLEDVPDQPLSIINRTLRYVELRGPALIGLGPNLQFINVVFGILDENVDTIIWPIPRNGMLGPIVLQDSILESCRTESLGFTGSPEALDQMRRAIRVQ